MEGRKNMNDLLKDTLRDVSGYNGVICKEDTLQNLGIDSLNLFILVSQLEEKCQIVFEDEDINFKKLYTYGDLEEYVAKRKSELNGK